MRTDDELTLASLTREELAITDPHRAVARRLAAPKPQKHSELHAGTHDARAPGARCRGCRMIPIKEAARRVNRCVRTIRDWEQSGRLSFTPARGSNQQRYFTEAQIDELIKLRDRISREAAKRLNIGLRMKP